MKGARSAQRLSKYNLVSSPTGWAPGRGTSVAIGTALRAICAALVYRYAVISNSFPASMSFMVLLVTALGLLGFMQPWRGHGNVRWGHVSSKGMLLCFAVLLGNHYLRMAGPVRAVLCESAGTALFPSLVTAVARKPHRCVLGGLIVFAALCALQAPGLVPPAPRSSGGGTVEAIHHPLLSASSGRHAADRERRGEADRRNYPSTRGVRDGGELSEFIDEEPVGPAHHTPLPDDEAVHKRLRDELAEEEAEVHREILAQNAEQHGAPTHVRGLLSSPPTPPKAPSSTFRLDVPMALFSSGVMMSVATAGPRAPASLGGAKRRYNPRAEPPFVVAFAALFCAPCALWQFAFGTTVLQQLPTYLPSTCGPGCSALLAVAAMSLMIVIDAAPGVGLPELPMPSGTSPQLFLVSAVVLGAVDPFLGHPLGFAAILLFSTLIAWGAVVLTSWAPVHMAKPKPIGKRRQANTPAWLVPAAQTYDSLMLFTATAVKHIVSAPKQRRLFVFLCINGGFMVIEFVCGASNNSIGLMSDACHMLFDNASITVGMYAAYMAQHPPTHYYTYGFARFEVLSGFANAVILVFIALLIVLESVERMMDPPDMSTDNLMLVSVVGLVVNIVGLLSFHEAHLHGVGGDCPFHDHSGNDKCCGEDHGVGSQMVLSPQGNVVAMGSSSGEITLVDVETGEQGGKLEGYPGGTLIWAPSGMELECRAEALGISVTWDMTTGKVVRGTPPTASGTFSEASVLRSKPRSKSPSGSAGLVDHNMRAMFLHVLADTLGSVGVIVSTFFVEHYGWNWTDPVAAVFISVLVIWSVTPLLQQSAEVLLLRVPAVKELAIAEAMQKVLQVEGVHTYQQPHFWANTPSSLVGSLRVKTHLGSERQRVLREVQSIFSGAGVALMCIQVEDSINTEMLQNQQLRVEHVPSTHYQY